MADNFQSSKVSANEQSSAAKFNNFVQAVEDAVNSLDDSNVQTLAAIAVAKLAAGSNGDVLTTVAGAPTWSPPASGATYQTTLPGSPTNGQETVLVDSTTAPTYAWRLRYNSAKSSNKWDFLGGAPLYAETTTSETTTSTSYANLSGGATGPAIALPVAGDYFVSTGFRGTSTATAFLRMSYDIGGTGAVDADAVIVEIASGGSDHMSVSRTRKKLALGAVTLTAKYRTTTGTGTWVDRWIQVLPIAVGG